MQSFGHFLQAVSAFNYHFISLLLKGLAETWRVIVILLGSFIRAAWQIAVYLCGILMEVIQLGKMLVDLCISLSMLLGYILKFGYDAFNWLGQSIASALSPSLHYAYDCMSSVSQYFGLASFSTLQWIQTGTMSLVTWSGDCSNYLCQRLYCWVVKSFKALAQLLITARNGVTDELLAIQDNCISVGEQLHRSISEIVTYATTNIPKDLYVWLLCSVCLTYILVCMMRYLTLHRFQSLYRRNNDIELILDNMNFDMIDSSEDEVEFDENEEDSEGEDYVDDTDEDSMNSSDSTLEDDDDDVEEYEVVTDSDENSDNEDEENNPNQINVQLPAPEDRYTLRSRTTPLGNVTNRQLSSSDMEKILERERDNRACVVCQDAVKCVLVLPCRHMCLCVECAHQFLSARRRSQRLCPLCRTPIETIMNVYI